MFQEPQIPPSYHSFIRNDEHDIGTMDISSRKVDIQQKVDDDVDYNEDENDVDDDDEGVDDR